jgi:hypothetical protein
MMLVTYQAIPLSDGRHVEIEGGMRDKEPDYQFDFTIFCTGLIHGPRLDRKLAGDVDSVPLDS